MHGPLNVKMYKNVINGSQHRKAPVTGGIRTEKAFWSAQGNIEQYNTCRLIRLTYILKESVGLIRLFYILQTLICVHNYDQGKKFFGIVELFTFFIPDSVFYPTLIMW